MDLTLSIIILKGRTDVQCESSADVSTPATVVAAAAAAAAAAADAAAAEDEMLWIDCQSMDQPNRFH